jgi:hypothetical protein
VPAGFPVLGLRKTPFYADAGESEKSFDNSFLRSWRRRSTDIIEFPFNRQTVEAGKRERKEKTDSPLK